MWCAEKARVASFVALLGVIVNVVLNLLLLPRLGLPGAVLATAAANGVVLFLMLGLCSRHGFRVHRGTVVGLLLPMSIPLGPWIVLMTLMAVVLDAIGSDHYLSHEEKREFWAGAEKYLGKFGLRLPQREPVL